MISSAERFGGDEVWNKDEKLFLDVGEEVSGGGWGSAM